MYSVVGSDGQVYGPVNMPTLEQWVKEGRIVSTTNMIDPIDGRVYRAQDLPLMQPFFEVLPPVPAPTVTRPPMMNVPSAQMPVQTYATYPRPMPGTSPKSKVAAIVLAVLLGGLGIHRFYLGYTGTGVAMLLLCVLTCGWGGIITGIWALIDVVLIATDALPDSTGQRLS